MNNRSYITCFPLSLTDIHYNEGCRSEAFESELGVIGIVQNGSGMLFPYGTSSSMLREGSFFIAHPGECFELMADPGSSLKISLVYYSAVSIHGDRIVNPKLSMLQGVCGTYTAASSLTVILLFQLRQAMIEQSDVADIRKQLALNELLLHLFAHQQSAGRNGNESIQATIDYMEQHFSKPLQISELPQLAGMTPSSYCRAFKKRTGLTPGSYLTKLRMQKAKELMANKFVVLRDIAVSVGYQDELYFSRVFKKTEGISPSVYLKRHDRRIAVVSHIFLQDHLLALGILPIAAPSYPTYFMTPSGFPSYLHDRLTGTVALNAEHPIRSSDVVKLAPELIIRTKLKIDPEDKYWGENKSAICIDQSTTWEHYFRTIASLVDCKTDAERIIRSISQLEQDARRKLEPVTKQGEWTIVRLLPGNCRLYGVKDHAFTELFYGRLRFKPDERVTHSSYMDNAFEHLVELDPEQLLVIWSDASSVNAFSADPRWQQLKAIKESRVYYPDSREWDPWGPIGRGYMIKAMLRFFERL